MKKLKKNIEQSRVREGSAMEGKGVKSIMVGRISGKRQVCIKMSTFIFFNKPTVQHLQMVFLNFHNGSYSYWVTA